MPQLRIVSVTNVSFYAVRENKILAKNFRIYSSSVSDVVFRNFLLLTLVAILFFGAKTICAILVEGIRR